MDYIILNYDSVNLIATIQVTGCLKDTYIDTSTTAGPDDPNYADLLESIAQSVLVNMNPESPTYDPTLTE